MPIHRILKPAALTALVLLATTAQVIPTPVPAPVTATPVPTTPATTTPVPPAPVITTPASITPVEQVNVSFSSTTVSLARTSGPLDFGIGDCQNETTTTLTATFFSPVPPNSTLAVFLSTSEICATTAPAGTIMTVTDLSNTVTLTVSARDVAGFGTTCPRKTIRKAVCVLATSSSAVSPAAFLTLTFHGVPPNTPMLNGAEGGDSSAHLKWATAGVINHVTIYHRQLNAGFGSDANPCDPPAIVELDAGLDLAGHGHAGDAGGEGAADAGFDTSLFASTDSKSPTGDLVTGLVNGATYLFFIVAVDPFGNASGQSNALTATPQLVQDFYRRYRCEGGQERGGLGCTSAGAVALVPALGGLALVLRRRRERRG